MKYFILCMAAAIVISFTPKAGYAQSSNDKNETIATVGALAITGVSAVAGLFGGKKKNKKAKETTVDSQNYEEDATSYSGASADVNSGQDAPMKIVTNHPDLQVKVKRCAASGKTVVLDLVFNNLSTSDVENCNVYGGRDGAEAFDDEGNIYDGSNVTVSIANKADFKSYSWGDFSIVAGVPLKVTYKIEGVSPSAESLARIKVPFYCKAWGLGASKPIVIRNVPIARD